MAAADVAKTATTGLKNGATQVFNFVTSPTKVLSTLGAGVAVTLGAVAVTTGVGPALAGLAAGAKTALASVGTLGSVGLDYVTA